MKRISVSRVERATCGWQGLAVWQIVAVSAMTLLLVPTRPLTLSAAENHAASAVLPITDTEASSEAEMKPYTERVEHTTAEIDMVPIRGGEFLMGSLPDEEGRSDNEGPQHRVKVAPFWMSKCEIPWEVYEVWMFDLDVQRRRLAATEPNARDIAAEEYQVSQPTPPYTDMTFGMGKKGYPAICMTQLAARTFCDWLSAKTGRYYRLPTEAEWEYACRAGTESAYYFGDDPAQLDEYAWYWDNSDEKYQQIGLKKPNAWGLYDMHGNVAEWVLDQYVPDYYQQFEGQTAINPLAIPTTEYPRVVRGGSWYDDPQQLRSAARAGSTPDWKQQDPQIPKSIWYFTDALHVGFRIVRPLDEPTGEEKKQKWANSLPVFDRKAGR